MGDRCLRHKERSEPLSTFLGIGAPSGFDAGFLHDRAPTGPVRPHESREPSGVPPWGRRPVMRLFRMSGLCQDFHALVLSRCTTGLGVWRRHYAVHSAMFACGKPNSSKLDVGQETMTLGDFAAASHGAAVPRDESASRGRLIEHDRDASGDQSTTCRAAAAMGTCSSRVPGDDFDSSPARCGAPPLPADAKRARPAAPSRARSASATERAGKNRR